MAANGADATDIAWVLGLTGLPWSLKFFNGFLMDRYTYLPMGRRRGWVLGAQGVMILVFLAAAVIQPEAGDILLLGTLGFLGNLATTYQDIGVDGMAVDLLSEEERARGGGVMFGGQLIGTAAATAGTGWAVVNLGAAGAYLLAALGVLAVSIYVACIRERDGERHFPWSPGQAHPVNLAHHAGAWLPILKITFRSIIMPVSLLWAVVMLVKGGFYGFMAGVTPLIGVQEAGMSEGQVTALTGSAQLVAGIVGLILGSWLGDRLGAKWSSLLMLAGWVVFYACMALTQPLWSDPTFARWMIFGWFSLDTLLSAVTIPITMRLCRPEVAATQFTIYMALNNLGISLGTVLLGFSDRLGGLVNVFPILLAATGVAILILLTVPFPKRRLQ